MTSLHPDIAYQTLLDRREMRRHLAPFIKKTFETVDPGAIYQHNWHIDVISEFLEACYNRDIKRGIINIPPGSLKSISVNVALPAWAIGHNPSERIVSGSYSESLSLKHSVDTRLVMQSDWYKGVFPKVELAEDQNTKQKFQTTERGHRYAVSVGGTVTGEGGNILIVDDPINPKKAMSDTERNTANDWFDQTFYTRLRDKKEGVIIVIMQRLHTDDLTGHLLAKGGWELLKIPAVAEEDETWNLKGGVYIRKQGEFLHSEREGAEEIEDAKKELGSYGFAGQYQQRPSPREGGMIELKWFKRYKTPPSKFIRIVHSWDTASKEKEINDNSALIKWGETEDGYYVLDVYKDRIRYPILKKKAIGFYDRDNPDTVLIEDKSSGQALIQDLREDTKMPVIAIEPCGDKVTRLDTCAPVVEAGNVYLPESAPWLVDFENDLCNFPNIPKKDVVDAFSQFLNWIKKPEKTPRIRSLMD